MKFLLVSYYGLSKAGTQHILMGVFRNLKARGFDADILVFLNKEGFYDKEIINSGSKIFRIPLHYSSNRIKRKINYYFSGFTISRKIKKILSLNKYNGVYCFNELNSGIILKQSFKFKIPVRIVESNSSYYNDKLFLDRLINKYRRHNLIKYSTIRIAPSNKVKLKIFNTTDNFMVISPGYDNTRFKFIKATTSKKLILIHVASFNENKNQKFSLKVFKKIKDIYKNSTLIFVGFETQNNYKKELEQYCKHNNLSNDVFFYKEDADIPTLMSDCFAFLFPSKKETFGIVLLEAQAVGLHCYCSNTIPTSANVGGCSFLPIDSGDKSIWASKIISDFKESKELHQKYDCSNHTYDKCMSEKVSFLTKKNEISSCSKHKD